MNSNNPYFYSLHHGYALQLAPAEIKAGAKLRNWIIYLNFACKIYVTS